MLDTWFSSGLWPFSTLGWPDETPDLEALLPDDVLDDGLRHHLLLGRADDLAGLELWATIPFHDVVIHSYLANPDGSRMGRTPGTAVEPEDVLEPYGADATRYGLLKVTRARIRASRSARSRRGASSRTSCGTRAAHAAEDRRRRAEARPRASRSAGSSRGSTPPRAELEDCLARFDFAAAVKLLYRLTFDDFCDWYAEAIKPRLYAEDDDARATALAALERLLKLLHPVMPHVTEEIWSQLPTRPG